VVLGVVDGVDANSVDAEVLELLDVALALLGVGQGVLVGRGTAGLIVDATDVESVLASPEGCALRVSTRRVRRPGRAERTVPLPEAETVGRLARLLGACLLVFVGDAVTTPRAARAETSVYPFIIARWEYGCKDTTRSGYN